MFVSITYDDFYEPETKRARFNVHLKDTDFEESFMSYHVDDILDIIDVYEKRNLNVAKNIFLYLKFWGDKEFGNASIAFRNYLSRPDADECKLKIKKYIPEIKKYFLFT